MHYVHYLTNYYGKLYYSDEVEESSADIRAFYVPVSDSGLLFNEYCIKATTLKKSMESKFYTFTLNDNAGNLELFYNDQLITLTPFGDICYYDGKIDFPDFKGPMIAVKASNQDDTISGNRLLLLGYPIYERK